MSDREKKKKKKIGSNDGGAGKGTMVRQGASPAPWQQGKKC